MSAIAQQSATNVLAGLTAQAAFVATVSPTKVKLNSAVGSEAASGTEITAGGGYTAGGVTVAWAAPTVQTGTYSGRIGNAVVTITNMPAAASITSVDIVDSTATPRRIFWGNLTATRSTAAGDTLSFPADSLVAQI